ncbi:Scr1 family TA system antitoxin-like transcriptional regulator, partial [Streptomyces sp. NPDC060028]|uniref:Scr1 family TA system antitoxin-like transcriptional regulator n=1 Tax=Streptomyces sp. NPDC060028 TaxID=3347041 RepID=UPI0036A037AB
LRIKQIQYQRVHHSGGGPVFLEDPEDVDAFAMAFDAVVDAALDVDASREMIKSYMKGKTP